MTPRDDRVEDTSDHKACEKPRFMRLILEKAVSTSLQQKACEKPRFMRLVDTGVYSYPALNDTGFGFSGG